MSILSRVLLGRGKSPAPAASPADAAALELARSSPDLGIARLVEARLDEIFAEASNENPQPLLADRELPPTSAPAEPAEATPGEEADTVQIFAEITRGYIAPVQRFVAHLRRGPYSSKGLELYRPAMEMVARAAGRMPVGDLVPKLSRFSAALYAAVAPGEPTVDGPLRQRILDAYADLEHALPEAFRIEAVGGPADDVIVLSLLKQIPEVGTVTLDKIFGAGLTSAEMFGDATPHDVAVTTGISESLAVRICVRIQGYLASRPGQAAPAAYGERVTRLADLVAELREAHEAYERLRRAARSRWMERRRRLDVVLKINLALAEFGERDMIEQLQKLPFQRRIARLSTYVQSLGGTFPTRARDNGAAS